MKTISVLLLFITFSSSASAATNFTGSAAEVIATMSMLRASEGKNPDRMGVLKSIVPTSAGEYRVITDNCFINVSIEKDALGKIQAVMHDSHCLM